MKLSEYRKETQISQAGLARKLTDFAGRYVCPRTIGHWELGGMPGKFWREKLRLFTSGKVTVVDFE